MNEFTKNINNLIGDNHNKEIRIVHDKISFRSRLEIEWYKVFKETYPGQKIFYEPVRAYRRGHKLRFVHDPDKYTQSYESYVPDFAILPIGWKTPDFVGSNRESTSIGERAVFIETKPDNTDVIRNQIHLVESHIVLIFGYPLQRPNFYLVKTYGDRDRNNWEQIKYDNFTDAVKASFLDRDQDDKRFMRSSKFTSRKK